MPISAFEVTLQLPLARSHAANTAALTHAPGHKARAAHTSEHVAVRRDDSFRELVSWRVGSRVSVSARAVSARVREPASHACTVKNSRSGTRVAPSPCQSAWEQTAPPPPPCAQPARRWPRLSARPSPPQPSRTHATRIQAARPTTQDTHTSSAIRTHTRAQAHSLTIARPLECSAGRTGTALGPWHQAHSLTLVTLTEGESARTLSRNWRLLAIERADVMEGGASSRGESVEPTST